MSATVPDDMALMTPQRAIGRQIGPAFCAWRRLQRRWRRSRTKTHLTFPRRHARAGRPPKPLQRYGVSDRAQGASISHFRRILGANHAAG
jgi:hypothetical protein